MADETFPVTVTDSDLASAGLPASVQMSPGLAIFFNDSLFKRCKEIASIMAEAHGIMPKHLVERPQACFAVVSRAIVWRLDPFSVALSTYQTPGGSVGYEGKLIQAILEKSGQLEGGINYELKGDWNKVKGKFTLQAGRDNKGKFPVPTWTPEDAKGLSVIVSAQVRGETTPRELEFELIEAFPLNSPLWATAPHRQIKYTAVRAFANQVVPSLLMGVPFDVDPSGFYGDPMTDVTPKRPERGKGTMTPPAPKTSSGFERGRQETSEKTAPVTVVEEEEVEVVNGEPAGGPEPGEQTPATDPKPEPETQPSETKSTVTFETAEKAINGLTKTLPDCKDADDLAETKSRGRTLIDSIEGLTEDERTILRGRWMQATMEEQRRREKKGKRS